MRLRAVYGLCGLLLAWPIAPAAAEGLNVDRLDEPSIATLQSTLQHLQPLITEKKKDGAANLLTWEQLYEPLPAEEQAFLDAFRQVKAEALGSTSHYFGEIRGGELLVPVGNETVKKPEGIILLDPQFLPSGVFDAYRAMMQAMKLELGRRLYVESGYRAAAYQLYLFLFYLPKHGYSIRETNRFVALPGYSEHGYPPRQAIDFINELGINGEDHPEEFEALPEYAWLQQHAARFGFSLSYPRDNAQHTSFEPWHWHFQRKEP